MEAIVICKFASDVISRHSYTHYDEYDDDMKFSRCPIEMDVHKRKAPSKAPFSWSLCILIILLCLSTISPSLAKRSKKTSPPQEPQNIPIEPSSESPGITEASDDRVWKVFSWSYEKALESMGLSDEESKIPHKDRTVQMKLEENEKKRRKLAMKIKKVQADVDGPEGASARNLKRTEKLKNEAKRLFDEREELKRMKAEEDGIEDAIQDEEEQKLAPTTEGPPGTMAGSTIGPGWQVIQGENGVPIPVNIPEAFDSENGPEINEEEMSPEIERKAEMIADVIGPKVNISSGGSDDSPAATKEFAAKPVIAWLLMKGMEYGKNIIPAAREILAKSKEEDLENLLTEPPDIGMMSKNSQQSPKYEKPKKSSKKAKKNKKKNTYDSVTLPPDEPLPPVTQEPQPELEQEPEPPKQEPQSPPQPAKKKSKKERRQEREQKKQQEPGPQPEQQPEPEPEPERRTRTRARTQDRPIRHRSRDRRGKERRRLNISFTKSHEIQEGQEERSEEQEQAALRTSASTTNRSAATSTTYGGPATATNGTSASTWTAADGTELVPCRTTARRRK